MAGFGTESGEWAHVSAFNSIDDCLIATLHPNVNDQYLRRLEVNILSALQRGDYRTLIIDATSLDLIDATDFNRLRRVIDMARLMGVETIFVGLKPGIVASLVELGANFEGLVTALNLEKALQIAGGKRATKKTFSVRDRAIRTETDLVAILSILRSDALGLGFNDYDVTRLVTAASELSRNILKYAGFGKVTYSKLVDGTKIGVKFVARDQGPGIANVELALADNYSSSGTLGLGLPGVKRLADDFLVTSEVGVGTTVAFKVWKS